MRHLATAGAAAALAALVAPTTTHAAAPVAWFAGPYGIGAVSDQGDRRPDLNALAISDDGTAWLTPSTTGPGTVWHHAGVDTPLPDDAGRVLFSHDGHWLAPDGALLDGAPIPGFCHATAPRAASTVVFDDSHTTAAGCTRKRSYVYPPGGRRRAIPGVVTAITPDAATAVSWHRDGLTVEHSDGSSEPLPGIAPPRGTTGDWAISPDGATIALFTNRPELFGQTSRCVVYRHTGSGWQTWPDHGWVQSCLPRPERDNVRFLSSGELATWNTAYGFKLQVWAVYGGLARSFFFLT